jgi:putative ABC transport system permease protein
MTAPRLRRLLARVANGLRPGRREPDLAREVAAHLALLEDDFARRGLTRDEARLAARRAFGGVEQAKDRHRDARSFVWLDDARRDLQYAVRSLRRTPGFASVAVATLAIGIGATTAIFSVVQAVLLRPLPFPHADQIVELYENIPAAESPVHRPQRVRGIDVRELIELRSRARSFSRVASFNLALVSPIGSTDTALLSGDSVSDGTFDMLGTPPLLGRWFSRAEERPGADRVIVLSEATWRRYFNGDPDALGRTIAFTGNSAFVGAVALGETYTVVGVMPRGFQYPGETAQFWVPLALNAPSDNRTHRLPMVARLANGVSAEAAVAEVTAILHDVRGDVPSAKGSVSAPPRFELTLVSDELTAPIKPALIVLTVAVAFVLLIACANVANLLLARTAARQQEIAVRVAIGAGYGRLIRQALTESVLLALLGGGAGIALAFGGVRAVRALAANLSRYDLQGAGVAFPRLDAVGIDASALAFALVVSTATGILFGLAPALRRKGANRTDALRGRTASEGQGGRSVQRTLVAAQIAIATLLFIGGGLLMRSFVKLANIDPGYDAAHALTFQVALRGDRYHAARVEEFAAALADRLRSAPGVQAAGYARQLPFVVLQDSFALRSTPDRPMDAAATPPVDARFVSSEYLTAMGIRVIAGRGLEDGDRVSHQRAMVINRTLAHRDFAGENPVGRLVYTGPDPTPWEIVGVVDDVRQFGLDREPTPQFFADLAQWPARMTPDVYLFPVGPYFVVRTRSDQAGVVAGALRLARQLDAEAAIYNVATMEAIASNSMTLPRLYAALLGMFAAIAVGLAAIGIYGMMAYSVTQRTREIGIRMALGASHKAVLRLVLRQSTVLTAIGLAAGLAGAAGTTRYLQGLLFGLTPLDPSTFLVVSLAFVGVAMLASYVPARRAMQVDPLVALRHE